MRSLIECDCYCHSSGSMRMTHVGACCSKCKFCGVRILPGLMDTHLKEAGDGHKLLKDTIVVREMMKHAKSFSEMQEKAKKS